MKKASIVLLMAGMLAALLGGCTNTVEPEPEEITFPIIFRFLNANDEDVRNFRLAHGVYYPDTDSSLYVHTGTPDADVGHWIEIVVDSTTNRRPGFPGVEAGMLVSVYKAWDGLEVPGYYRRWHVAERTIWDPDSNVISFEWPVDTTRSDVEEVFVD